MEPIGPRIIFRLRDFASHDSVALCLPVSFGWKEEQDLPTFTTVATSNPRVVPGLRTFFTEVAHWLSLA